MAQHDYSINNQGFPATRQDLNNVLEAIRTNNSGTSAPSEQYAGQFWLDTTSSNWVLYIHDGADDIQFATIDTSANTVNFIDSELGDNSVTTAKIADANVTSAKLSYPLTTFSSTGIDDNATSTAITIDSSENVGIGTSSPDEKLTLSADGSTASQPVAISLNANRASGSGGATSIIESETDGASSESRLKFYTRPGSGNNPTERMRIDSSGNVGIGTTSTTGDGLTIYGSTNNTILTLQNPNVTSGFRFYMGESGYSHQVLRLYDNSNRAVVNFDGQMGLTSFGSVQGEVDAGEKGVSIRGSVGQIRVGQDGTGLSTVMGFYNPNGEVGTIKVTGSSTQFNTSSDYRLKENVSYDFDATTRLKQLKPARFNFIADADTTVDGFLAHEVSSIVPEAISGEKDAVDENGNPEYQGIDQSKLVPLLVKTIQELEARITTLETNNP